MNGMKMKPPKYYKKILDKEDAETAEMIDYERYKKGIERRADNTEERLKVREKVLEAKMQFKKRTLR
jgi:hypothetical protein